MPHRPAIPDFVSLEWLLDHHSTKEQERGQMVASLPLKPGDQVLDLGCGPGLWTPLLAERVKANGRVIGVDQSPEMLAHAAARARTEPAGSLVEFRQGHFSSLPFPPNTFDLVFFSNCFYCATDFQAILNEQRRVTRPGGTIVSNHFDDGATIYYPMDPALLLKFMTATAQQLGRESPKEPFDNYVGRKLHGLFRQCGLTDVRSRVFATHKQSPLTTAVERYIAAGAEWQAQTAEAFVSKDELQLWRSYFAASSPHYILKRDDFFYCELDIQTIGTV